MPPIRNKYRTNLVTELVVTFVWLSVNVDARGAKGDLEIGVPIRPRLPNSPPTGDIISDTPSVWANSVYPSRTGWPSEPGIPYDPYYIGREQLCLHGDGPWNPLGAVVDYRLVDFEKIAKWALKENVELRDIGISSPGIRIASIKPPTSKDSKSARPPRLIRRLETQALFANVREFPGNSVPYFSPTKGKDAQLLAFLRRTGARVSKFEHSLRDEFLGKMHWLYYQAPIAPDELSFWIASLRDQPFVDDVTFWPSPFLPSKIAVRCFSNRDKRRLIEGLRKYGYFIQGGAAFPNGVPMDLYRITVPETGEAEAIRRMRALGLDASYAVIPGGADKTTTLSKRYSDRDITLENGKGFSRLDTAMKQVLQTHFGQASVISLGGGFFRVNAVYRGPKFLTSLGKSGWERIKCLASATVRGRTCFVRVQFDVDGTSKGDSGANQPLLSLFKEVPDSDELEVREAERIVDEIVVAISNG